MDKSENRFYREKEKPGMAYVGISGGKIRTIVVDDTRYAEDTATMLAEWIREGRTIERMSVDAAIDRMKAERAAAMTAGKRAD